VTYAQLLLESVDGDFVKADLRLRTQHRDVAGAAKVAHPALAEFVLLGNFGDGPDLGHV
jgi:hypothetical protein